MSDKSVVRRDAAVEALGEHHECNQGCGEGHCWANEQRHQVRLSQYREAAVKYRKAEK